VLYPADEFPSNRYVWQNLARFGVRAEPLPVVPGLGLAEQLDGLDLTGVRLVALSAVSYRDGRREDVAAVADLCHRHGLLLAVDAIQAVGCVPVDVRAWDCDFLACGGQKWLLGPVGSGFLFLRQDRLEEVHVPVVGWASSRYAGDPSAPDLVFCAGARRFEPGLPDVAAVVGLRTSIERLAATGWSAVFERVAAHNVALRSGCRDLGYRVIHDGPAETQGGIVTLDLEREPDAEALFRHLGERGIVVTQRAAEIRVAAHVTTTEAEVAGFLEALPAAGRSGRARSAAGVPGGPAATAAPATAAAPLPSRRPGWPAAAPGAGRWRLALITGASRGLGAGLAQALARRGGDLILVGRDRVALAALAEHLGTDWGVQVDPVVLDLADERAVGEWLTGYQARLAEVDVLVNCAAQAEAGLAQSVPLAAWRSSLEVGLLAPVRLAAAIVPHLVERGRGGVLNVVTSGARNALPVFGPYAATKGALWAWSEALTRELAGTGVTVTTFVPTHMDSRASRHLGRTALAYYAPGAFRGRLGRQAAADPRQVAERAVVALLSGRSVVVPLGTRLTLALNALAPELVTHRVAAVWQGPGSPPTSA
jgi:short-subunit dehydrogenase